MKYPLIRHLTRTGDQRHKFTKHATYCGKFAHFDIIHVSYDKRSNTTSIKLLRRLP